jgi:hypothetical protein
MKSVRLAAIATGSIALVTACSYDFDRFGPVGATSESGAESDAAIVSDTSGLGPPGVDAPVGPDDVAADTYTPADSTSASDGTGWGHDAQQEEGDAQPMESSAGEDAEAEKEGAAIEDAGEDISAKDAAAAADSGGIPADAPSEADSAVVRDAGMMEAAGETFTVGGAVRGLGPGRSITLQNNASDDLTLGADGPFTFAHALAPGVSYDVTISVPPPGQQCMLMRPAGIIGNGNVTTVDVRCH